MSETPPIPEQQPDPAASPEAAAPPELETPTEAEQQPRQPVIAEMSANACAAKLAELFPAVFSAAAAKPLKLRIQADIQQRAPGLFTRKSLSNFLHRHTTSTAYLRALANGESRIDLDGGSAGEISDEHRQAAAAELERRRELHAARRTAERDAQREVQRAAQREAQQQAVREHAAQTDVRRDRAGLLRAFESTTLTLANFCALKSIAPADLEASLALARQDREQAPQQPSHPAARPARTDPRDDDRRNRGAGKKRHEQPRPVPASRKAPADH